MPPSSVPIPAAVSSSTAFDYPAPAERNLRRVERSRQFLHRFDRLLDVAVCGALEARLEATQALLGLRILRLRAADMGAHELEDVLEPGEVLAELGAVGHDFACMLLDLQALEAEENDEQVGMQRRGRDRYDLALEGIAEWSRVAAQAVADEFVVHGLRGEVHERELVRAFVGADVLVGDRVDVCLHVAHELLRVGFALGVVGGFDQPVEVVQRKLRVDRHERAVEPDHCVDAFASAEAVLKLVFVAGKGVGEQVAQEKLAEPTPRLRRTKRLLEPREILRPVEHLRVRLADLAKLLMDRGRRAGCALEPRVDAAVQLAEAAIHRLDNPGQPAVDVGVSVRELLGELRARSGAETLELLLEPDGEHRDSGDDCDCDECDHGQRTLEHTSDGTPGEWGGRSRPECLETLLGRPLFSGPIPLFLRHVLVLLGPVLRHAGCFLVSAFSLHARISGGSARGLLPAAQQLVQPTHGSPPSFGLDTPRRIRVLKHQIRRARGLTGSGSRSLVRVRDPVKRLAEGKTRKMRLFSRRRGTDTKSERSGTNMRSMMTGA